MPHLISEKKIFYCPLKSNRSADGTQGKEKYKAVNSLEWSLATLETVKTVKIKGFPALVRLQLFQVIISNNKVECVVTNAPNVAKTGGTIAQIAESEAVLTTKEVRKQTAFR